MVKVDLWSSCLPTCSGAHSLLSHFIPKGGGTIFFLLSEWIVTRSVDLLTCPHLRVVKMSPPNMGRSMHLLLWRACAWTLIIHWELKEQDMDFKQGDRSGQFLVDFDLISVLCHWQIWQNKLGFWQKSGWHPKSRSTKFRRFPDVTVYIVKY